MIALTSTLESTAVQTLIQKIVAIRDSIKERYLNHFGAIFNDIESFTKEKANDEKHYKRQLKIDIQDKRSREAHEFNTSWNGDQQRNQQYKNTNYNINKIPLKEINQFPLLKILHDFFRKTIDVDRNYNTIKKLQKIPLQVFQLNFLWLSINQSIFILQAINNFFIIPLVLLTIKFQIGSKGQKQIKFTVMLIILTQTLIRIQRLYQKRYYVNPIMTIIKIYKNQQR